MTTQQQKAEAYVREKLPELKGFEETDGDGFGQMDDPIQPYHWLQTLVEATKDTDWMLNNKNELVKMTNYGNQHFKNEYLVIGTERFYKAFNDIIGI